VEAAICEAVHVISFSTSSCSLFLFSTHSISADDTSKPIEKKDGKKEKN